LERVDVVMQHAAPTPRAAVGRPRHDDIAVLVVLPEQPADIADVVGHACDITFSIIFAGM